ncbi:MAG TPA: biotin--[acetyl-CoA-carboxylase] ligase [bacterium]|nr:biotin--[acetyl-CoA-carboxylase] ligase [bacterium]
MRRGGTGDIRMDSAAVVADSRAWIGGQAGRWNEAVRTAVMRVFVERPLAYINLEEIARMPGLSRGVAAAAIEALVREGVNIQSRAPLEYFVEPDADAMHPDCVTARLRTRWWGRAVWVGGEITSTIDIAKELINQDDSHGTVITAEYQKQGRGRQGSRWISRKGRDLLVTFLIQLADWEPSPTLLSLYAVTAVARVLDTAYQIPVSIKWPNDVIIQGRKAGGVLVEKIDARRMVLISLGLNVHSRPADWPPELRGQTTSLALARNEDWQRDLLLAQCGTTWEALWEHMVRDRGETVRSYWRQYSSTLGRPVTLRHRRQSLTGVAQDIDEWGRLILRAGDGRVLHLLQEEVRDLEVIE